HPPFPTRRYSDLETCLQELRTLAHPERIDTDIKERRFVEHTVQVCIQAVQDVASHVVLDQRLGEPRTNQELLGLLRNAGWLEPELSEALRLAVGFRYFLVHGYIAVDLNVLRDVIWNHLGDIDRFVEPVRHKIGS